jgi:hypothetical protein
MLKPIINHQKEVTKIYEKMKFLRDNFNIENQDAFYEELIDLIKEIRSEIDYHFNLQFHSITNEKAKKFVIENKLVRDILFRMLDYIKAKCVEKSMDAFLKFDDFEEILRAYFKKERGLFIQQLRSVLDEKELQEIEENLQKLI